MSPRRVHRLMLDHFPACREVDCEWVVAVDQDGLVVPVAEKLINENIEGDELLIEVRRNTGACLGRSEALAYIKEHAESGMRIANRSFDGFVVIASNGVATGWRAEAATSTDPERDD